MSKVLLMNRRKILIMCYTWNINLKKQVQNQSRMTVKGKESIRTVTGSWLKQPSVLNKRSWDSRDVSSFMYRIFDRTRNERNAPHFPTIVIQGKCNDDFCRNLTLSYTLLFRYNLDVVLCSEMWMENYMEIPTWIYQYTFEQSLVKNFGYFYIRYM